MQFEGVIMAAKIDNELSLTKTDVSNGFYVSPILNSPYELPTRYWETDKETNQPTGKIIESRRPSSLITPIPNANLRLNSGEYQPELFTESYDNVDYATNDFINSIRAKVDEWRLIEDSSKWGVTPETARLLKHWRNYDFPSIRPFFCQIEAVETLIWLTEVAPKTSKNILEKISDANQNSNPDLYRIAFKLATGAGKTTVMAMIIAWQTINAVKHGINEKFTKAFLICAPGITIRDRLRVLLPNDPESYYKHRQLVPEDYLQLIEQARIVITNYHAFMLKDIESVAPTAKLLLAGANETKESLFKETPEQMLRRVMSELLNCKSVLVINDEAHHCYRKRPDDSKYLEEGELETQEDKQDAKANAETARIWISGLEYLRKTIPLTRVIDLSATPFFLKGSGYKEGTLFPWTVSDFSLMDALECGIVKLPRIPIRDSWTDSHKSEVPIYRNLWDYIKKDMPKKSRSQGGNKDPQSLPNYLKTAIELLYQSYKETYVKWKESKINVPPCFIFVCQNTAISKLVYDYISGYYTSPDSNGDVQFVQGKCDLFSNFDEEEHKLIKPRTILIDSLQLESGGELSKEFRAAAAEEIEIFKDEYRSRTGDLAGAENLSDADLLREVMNTVGKAGKLGGDVRCVVSVSMLTEGWDANNVTHILGVRAFGTQLLCEQVVGRGLRRISYDINPETNLFNAEFSEIFGIPFDFAGDGTIINTPPEPPDVVQVKAIHPDRDHLTIRFPKVKGYYLNVDANNVAIEAMFSEESKFVLKDDDTGPINTSVSGFVGPENDLIIHAKDIRESEVVAKLTSEFIARYYSQGEKFSQMDKTLLFPKIKRLVIQWYREYLSAENNMFKEMVIFYENFIRIACEKINVAIVRCQTELKNSIPDAFLDSYEPTGTTYPINFRINRNKKPLFETDADKCPINYAVCDSGWEVEFCKTLESNKRTISYVKNYNLGFEVPYTIAGESKKYLPDFIVLISAEEKGYTKENPLHLVVEIKGFKYIDANIKKEQMETFWIPSVNKLGVYGHWAFIQLDEVDFVFDSNQDDAFLTPSFKKAYDEKLEEIIKSL